MTHSQVSYNEFLNWINTNDLSCLPFTGSCYTWCCTVPSPGVDQSQSQSQSQGQSQQIDCIRRRLEKASLREDVAKIGHHPVRRRRCYSPIPMGRKDHGGSDTTGRPQAGFTSGDFIFNLVIAYSDMLEIGTRQLNNWRLHEPPDFLPSCQPGALPTRLYCSRVPRHHSRPPGRYSVTPRYLWVGKTMEGVTPREGLKHR